MKSRTICIILALTTGAGIAWKVLNKSNTQSSNPSSSTLINQDPSAKVDAQSLPAPSTPPEAQSYSIPKVQSFQEFEDEYTHLSSQELEQSLKNVEAALENKMLIKKANAQRLSAAELSELTEGIRKKSTIRKILLDRKIAKLEEKL